MKSFCISLFGCLVTIGLVKSDKFGQICETPACKQRSAILSKQPFHETNLATAKANNEFAVRLHRLLIKSSPDGNLFYSPFSISTAFGLLQAGANGKTLREINDVFRWNELSLSTDLSLNQLLRQIQYGQESKLNVVNSVWLGRLEQPKAQYRKRLRSFFNSPLWLADFARRPQAVVAYINKWVANSTKGMIQDLIPVNAVDSRTRLILVNAMFFKSQWEKSFPAKDTVKKQFYSANGKKIRVPMMIRYDKYYHAFDDNRKCQVLRVPYAKESFAMFLVLPFEGIKLSAIEAVMDAKAFNDWSNGMTKYRMKLHLPRFKLAHSINIKSALQQMGLNTTFSSSADFSQLTAAPGLFVDKAIHKAVIEVNEEGTKAAAATAILKGRTFIPEFVANRPFLFYIVESTTGAILFAGRVADASQLQ